MEFFRLMTWYHTGTGFFVNTALTMLSVLAMVWTILFLSIMRIYTEGSVMAAYLGTVQLLQLGTVSVLGFWFTMALEAGVLVATWTVVRQIVQGEGGGCWWGLGGVGFLEEWGPTKWHGIRGSWLVLGFRAWGSFWCWRRDSWWQRGRVVRQIVQGEGLGGGGEVEWWGSRRGGFVVEWDAGGSMVMRQTVQGDWREWDWWGSGRV